MAHAEVLHAAEPLERATDAIVAFVNGLRYAALDSEVRHYAKRHLLDTIGVMIAGADGNVATNAEAMLASVRGAGNVPVPGRAPVTPTCAGADSTRPVRSARSAPPWRPASSALSTRTSLPMLSVSRHPAR